MFRSRVRRSFRDIRTRLARLNAFLNENLSGMSTVQLLESRGAQLRTVPRHQRRASRREPACELLPRGVLPAARTRGRDRGVADRLVRRPPGDVDRHHARHAGGLHPVHAALLPPDFGPEREVRHPAAGDGLRRSASSSCSTTPDDPGARGSASRSREPGRVPAIQAPAAPRVYAPRGVRPRVVRLPRRALGAGGCQLHDRARRARRDGRRHRRPARPRSPACCCASTSRSAA